jgi:TRAP-type C4-dicarboxylate transport system permease small subunit
MSEEIKPQARPTDPVGRVLFVLSYWAAVLGGLVVCAMAIMTTVSVTGRYFFNAPVEGDFELVAILTGISVFLFLPYVQLTRANVIVDFFLSGASPRLRGTFDSLGGLVYVGIATLFFWRQWIGMNDFIRTGETSLILEVPRWWTLPLAVACLFLLVAVCVYTLVQYVQATRRGATL